MNGKHRSFFPSHAHELVYRSRNLLFSTLPVCSAVLRLTAVLISQAFQFSHSPQWALYTKSPSIVRRCLPLRLPLSPLPHSFLPLPFCSQANNGVSVSLLQIPLCNQLADKHCTSLPLPNAFPRLPSYCRLTLKEPPPTPPNPDKVTGNPQYSHILYSHIPPFPLSAWAALIASFGLRSHPLACHCCMSYEQYYNPIFKTRCQGKKQTKAFKELLASSTFLIMFTYSARLSTLILESAFIQRENWS